MTGDPEQTHAVRFDCQPHRFYAGIDLHARSMFTHILDHAGQTVFERDLPASPDPFRNAIAPFRAGLVIGVECMFAWYWLADLCEGEAIPFALGHALYMKAIHGGKAKNPGAPGHRRRQDRRPLARRHVPDGLRRSSTGISLEVAFYVGE
jgi:hypothetical protein